MKRFDKYIMFLSEQYETADAEIADGAMPEIKLDMEGETEGLSEEERIEKFEQLEDIVKELIEDDEEREELVQKLAAAAGIEAEMGEEEDETHEGEPESHKEDDDAAPVKKKKKADKFPAFGSGEEEAAEDK